jgi:hypothetical protein
MALGSYPHVADQAHGRRHRTHRSQWTSPLPPVGPPTVRTPAYTHENGETRRVERGLKWPM